MKDNALKHDEMGRLLVMLSGLLPAGIYTLVMFMIHGSPIWDRKAEQLLPYYEASFWLIASSGIIALVIHDILEAIKSRMKKWGLGADISDIDPASLCIGGIGRIYR